MSPIARHTCIDYRSDAVRNLLLGERITINFPAELKPLCADAFAGLQFRRFDGGTIAV